MPAWVCGAWGCNRQRPCSVCRENQNIDEHQCGWCDARIANPQNKKGGFPFCGPAGNSTCEWLFYERFPNYVERRAV